ncbi:MAG: aminoacyl-tRNA hydrolase [Planctomycetota bacterium]|nr:aminoacyl-tRNA hydrolase [Planctomycetaceae bacterium]MDQ3332485.1 aminoacyl-tRNA hydrolase [Planctomycetota bacterium]
MKLVVGLGNPGPEYQRTRHNVGFEVVEELVRRHANTSPQRRFDAEAVEIFLDAEKVLLLSPLTYMNLSGRSVGAAIDFYKLPPENALVVCDDLNLEPGRLRLRADGSAGGQNGLKDIFRRLGTEAVPRLRIGIGRPPGRMTATDYVLGKFTEQERVDFDLVVAKAADGVEQWVRGGIMAAMNAVNAKPAIE